MNLPDGTTATGKPLGWDGSLADQGIVPLGHPEATDYTDIIDPTPITGTITTLTIYGTTNKAVFIDNISIDPATVTAT
jgi:hypothetical protein